MPTGQFIYKNKYTTVVKRRH